MIVKNLGLKSLLCEINWISFPRILHQNDKSTAEIKSSTSKWLWNSQTQIKWEEEEFLRNFLSFSKLSCDGFCHFRAQLYGVTGTWLEGIFILRLTLILASLNSLFFHENHKCENWFPFFPSSLKTEDEDERVEWEMAKNPMQLNYKVDFLSLTSSKHIHPTSDSIFPVEIGFRNLIF